MRDKWWSIAPESFFESYLMSSFFLQVSGAAASAVNLPSQINNVYLVGIGLIGFVALAGIIIGGFQYVASAGNAERASHAKTTIIASVSGLMLALLSVFILNIFSPQFTVFSGDWFLPSKDTLEGSYATPGECAAYSCGYVRLSNGQYSCIKGDCTTGSTGNTNVPKVVFVPGTPNGDRTEVGMICDTESNSLTANRCKAPLYCAKFLAVKSAGGANDDVYVDTCQQNSSCGGVGASCTNSGQCCKSQQPGSPPNPNASLVCDASTKTCK